MIRHKSFVFKLKPDGATRRSLAKACGCVRFVYNKGLDWNKEQREKDQTFRVNYPKLCALLPEWKEKFPWLGECHSQVLQQGMKDLMTAMVNFFEGRSQFPRFHKKFKDEDSIRFPQGFKVDEARRQIYLPKIGWLGYRRSRFINGKLRSVTVMRKADGWYVSILTEREIEA
ncbi:RNA-guided endonuclease InsQ/TnpB family protein, partial [Sutterella wadsworthensis]